MLGKKDYQLFADAVSQISDDVKRNEFIEFLKGIFSADNPRFSIERFNDWIDRRRTNKSMKGTRYNPKYMPLGVK